MVLEDDLLKSGLSLENFAGVARFCSNCSIKDVVGAIDVVSRSSFKLSLEFKLFKDAAGCHGMVFGFCPAGDCRCPVWFGVTDLEAASVAAMNDGDLDVFIDPFPGSRRFGLPRS